MEKKVFRKVVNIVFFVGHSNSSSCQFIPDNKIRIRVAFIRIIHTASTFAEVFRKS